MNGVSSLALVSGGHESWNHHARGPSTDQHAVPSWAVRGPLSWRFWRDFKQSFVWTVMEEFSVLSRLSPKIIVYYFKNIILLNNNWKLTDKSQDHKQKFVRHQGGSSWRHRWLISLASDPFRTLHATCPGVFWKALNFTLHILATCQTFLGVGLIVLGEKKKKKTVSISIACQAWVELFKVQRTLKNARRKPQSPLFPRKACLT